MKVKTYHGDWETPKHIVFDAEAIISLEDDINNAHKRGYNKDHIEGMNEVLYIIKNIYRNIK